MRQNFRLGAALLMCLAVSPAQAADAVGKVSSAKATLTIEGSSGSSEAKDGAVIFFMDKLSTNETGLGEFVFNDGTKLAIGPSASLVVDQFVVKDQKTFKSFGVKATQGALRWISGSSPSSAYHITTPLGTMGVRGTAFDISSQGGLTHVVLLNGNARFCVNDECQTLGASGDYITSDGQTVSPPEDVRKKFKTRKEAAAIFPFLANPGLLSSAFQTPGADLLSNLAMNEPAQQQTTPHEQHAHAPTHQTANAGNPPGNTGAPGNIGPVVVGSSFGLAGAFGMIESMRKKGKDKDKPVTPQ